MCWSLKTCRNHPLFFWGGGCGENHWKQTLRMGDWAGNNDLDKCPLGMQLASVEDPWSSADDDPWGTVFFPQSLYYSGSTSLEIKGFLKNLLNFLYWSSNDVFVVGKSKSQYKLKQFTITLSFTIWRAPQLVFCRIIFQTVFPVCVHQHAEWGHTVHLVLELGFLSPAKGHDCPGNKKCFREMTGVLKRITSRLKWDCWFICLGQSHFPLSAFEMNADTFKW